MSAIQNIKDEIINKLDNLEDFNKVYGHEKLNPSGFPAIFVTFAGMDNEFFTNAENKRVYEYRILVLVQVGQKTVGETSAPDVTDEAEKAVQELTQRAIDALDSDYTLGDYGEMVYMEAVVGEPNYYEFEGGWARGIEFRVRIHSVYVV